MRKRLFSPYAHYLLRDANGTDSAHIRDGVYLRNPPELFESSDRVGVIVGMQLVFDAGPTLHLVPLPRGEDPHRPPRIENADQFRALLTAQELAEDAGDVDRVTAIDRRLDLAAFYECPRCHNNATDREVCTLRQSDGFVWERIEDPRHERGDYR